MKKGDFFVIFTVLAIAALFAFSPKGKNGKTVVVRENNKIVYKTALSENSEFSLKGNTIVIKDGKAYMKNADCKNRICVNHTPISKSGETIACLPNGVTVTVEG